MTVRVVCWFPGQVGEVAEIACRSQATVIPSRAGNNYGAGPHRRETPLRVIKQK